MKLATQFAGYRIDETLSPSAFKGYDELLDRPLCIKKINRHDKERLKAFASKLSAKPIEGMAQVYQAGEEEGQLYLVCEYLEGYQPLTRGLKTDPLALIQSIAKVLRSLHDRSLAYLGLNPQQILVGERGECTLSIFGFAEVVDPIEALCAKITEKTNLDLDAYGFLAPEQKRKEPAGAGADWYALGILLYWLKKGRLPEVGDRLEGPEQALFAKLTDPDPSQRVLKKPMGNPALPRATYRGVLPKHAHIEPIPSEMIVIPAGTYLRGSKYGPRDEMPQHKVKLSAFAMDIHPVTNEQFLRFLEAIGDVRSEQSGEFIRLKDSRISHSQSHFFIEAGYAKHPVVGVTWYGAKAYASWAGKRLPSEAQWEAAAGLATFPTGQSIDKKLANFFNNDTTAVMSYPPGANGLFDMAGNVYEWCEDWYDFHAYDIAAHDTSDPQGPVQGVYRVLRGGCWKSLENDLRCTHRHRNNPGAFQATYGFRCIEPRGEI